MEKFFNFTNIPAITPDIIHEAINADYKIFQKPHVNRADATLFKETNLFKKFSEKFENSYAWYFKNYPMSMYAWHTDLKRTCTVNWVIQAGPKSSTFFRDVYDNDLLTKDRLDQNLTVLFYKLTEVTYVQYLPTLMRTDIHHSIINNNPSDRIIMSMSSANASYDEVKDFLLNWNSD